MSKSYSPSFYAWDTETSLHNTGDEAVGKLAASPHSPKNWVVWEGMALVDPVKGEVHPPIVQKYPTKESFQARPPEPGVVLVGHNLKFDLQHMCNPNNTYADEWRSWIRNPASKVWDTQIAEYRLRGQWLVMPSMDTCCMLRGWPTKPGRLKEYWEAGISTEAIPDDEVEEYLPHDVTTTGRLFLDQLQMAERLGMMALLGYEMDTVLTLTDGELNGMAFDKRGATNAYEGEMAEEITKAELKVEEAMLEAGVPKAAIMPGSDPLMKVIVYGGTYKYKENRPLLNEDGSPLLFKSGKKKGQPRFKWHHLEWNTTPRTRAKTKTVDEDSLVKIQHDPSTDPALAKLIDVRLKWRKLRKGAADFVGYGKLTWPHDSLIHANLNQANVATGRLSSSAPNLQNASKKSLVRKHFKSRHPDGRIVEVDESQIEVVVQAVLSGDENMLADLHAGVDFHSKRTAIAAGVEYELVRQAYLNEDPDWTDKRDDAKIFSFQRAYGAGPALIASQTGMAFSAVQKLIEGEEKEYPGVKEMTDRWETEVAKSQKRFGDDVLGHLVSKTGARYIFKREMFRGKASFKPTMIKNYPIQGLAGDIIKIVLAQIRPILYAWSNLFEVYFINTVHDSILFDVVLDDKDLKRFTDEIVHVMTVVVDDVLREFGLDFQGLIKADVDVGSNWYKYHKDSNPGGMRPFKYEEAA